MFVAMVMIRCAPEQVDDAARAIVGFDGVSEV